MNLKHIGAGIMGITFGAICMGISSMAVAGAPLTLSGAFGIQTERYD